jgi:hypothetical protein
MQHPFTVLDHLQAGMLTKAHVEALDAMYPRLANVMRLEIGTKLAEAIAKGERVEPKVRDGAGLLLGVDLTNDTTPAMLLDVQSLHMAQKQPMGPSQAHPAGSGRPRKVDLFLSSSYRTETQSNEERFNRA